MRSEHRLAHVVDSAPALGAWVEQAACAAMDREIVGVYTADSPDELELTLAQRACARCPVQSPCADYAARVPVYGLWGGKWRGRRTRAARRPDSDDVRSTTGAGAVT